MSATHSLQFVDTNILIYAHDLSAGDKHARAQELVRQLWNSAEGCLSVQVLQEFYVNVTRKVAKPLAPEMAAQIVADLSAWHVHCPGVEDVLDAIALEQRHRISFWDAMIVSSAIQLGCDTIWSEDLSAGETYGRATVRRPF